MSVHRGELLLAPEGITGLREKADRLTYRLPGGTRQSSETPHEGLSSCTLMHGLIPGPGVIIEGFLMEENTALGVAGSQ